MTIKDLKVGQIVYLLSHSCEKGFYTERAVQGVIQPVTQESGPASETESKAAV